MNKGDIILVEGIKTVVLEEGNYEESYIDPDKGSKTILCYNKDNGLFWLYEHIATKPIYEKTCGGELEIIIGEDSYVEGISISIILTCPIPKIDTLLDNLDNSQIKTTL